MLDERSLRLIEFLLRHDDYVSMVMLSDFLDVSKRSVYYTLDTVNRWLLQEGFEVIANVRGFGFKLNESERNAIRSRLGSIHKEIVYTVDERLDVLTFVVLSNQRGINIEILCELTDVSRNTLFSDLKRVRRRLNQYALDLDYIPNEGYEVVGDPIKIRTAFLYYTWPVKALTQANRIHRDLNLLCIDIDPIAEMHMRLKIIEKVLNTEYVSGTLFGLASLIYIVLNVPQPDLVFNNESSYIHQTHEYQTLKTYVPELPEQEALYVSLHLLGARTQIPAERVHLPILTTLAVDLVDEFERIAAIKFVQRSALINQISNHLSVSYFRYTYGIHHGNPLAEQIKAEYHDVFDLTNQVCDIIRRELEVPVSDSEVAFITLHFSSYLRRKNYHTDEIRVDIVCPSGVSTSNMIKTEVENLHPQIYVNKVMSLEEYQRMGSKAHYVITSVVLDAPNAIKVNPIINNSDREHILRILRPQSLIHRVSSLENIMAIITPYVSEENLQPVRDALDLYLNRNRQKERRAEQPNLSTVLTQEKCRVVSHVETWQQALQEASKPLLQSQSIEESYIDKMIESVHNFGPYMVLDKGYMLAHASFEDGVRNLDCAFLKLDKSVAIEDKWINKIFILAPIDQVKHFMILKDLMRILGDESCASVLDACVDDASLYEVIMNFLEDTGVES